MKVIIIVGHTGTGKSPIVRQFIGKKRNCYIFDYQDEYGNRTKYPDQKPDNIPTDITLKRSRDIGCDVRQFIQNSFKKKNTVIVFEDATGFVHGNMGLEFLRLLTNKMFTKNTYILCFHSILDVPTPVMRKADTLIMLPTNDEQHLVEKKYPRLLPYFKKIHDVSVQVINMI